MNQEQQRQRIQKLSDDQNKPDIYIYIQRRYKMNETKKEEQDEQNRKTVKQNRDGERERERDGNKKGNGSI